MCESVKGLKFCSCLENGKNTIFNHKKSRSHKDKAAIKSDRIYRWALSRYIGDSDFQMDGLLMEPAYRLNQDITDMDLLSELNNRNCFDFDYTANQGDNLEVWAIPNGNNAPMSFIFESGKWKIAQYNKFTDKTEKINQGNLRFE